MTIYLIVLAAIPIFAIALNPSKSRSMRRLYVWIIFGFLAILAMIRSSQVGVDTEQYVGAYRAIGADTSFSFDSYRYEHGFTLLCKLLNYVSPNPQLLIMVSSAFIMWSVGYVVYRLSDDVALSAFLFISMNIYASYLNIMRQAIAIGFVLLGYYKILNRRWISAIVLFLVSTQFHQSAWLILLAFAFTFIPFNKITMLSYLTVGALLFIGSGKLTGTIAFLLGKEQFYDPNHTEANYYGALIQFIFVACLVFICFFYMLPQDNKYLGKEKSHVTNVYQNMLMLWLIFVALGVKVEVLARLSYYFSAMAILIIPYVLQKASLHERFAVRLIICSVCLVYFLIIGIARPQWYGVIPYSTDMTGVSNTFKSMFGY